MLNAKLEQRNGTHMQKQKHQNSPKRKQRSEAAPLTLLALHLYSQTPRDPNLAYTAAMCREWDVTHMITAKLTSPCFSFCKIVRVKVFFGVGVRFSERHTPAVFLSLQHNIFIERESAICCHKEGVSC